jgi:hypothetical protein
MPHRFKTSSAKRHREYGEQGQAGMNGESGYKAVVKDCANRIAGTIGIGESAFFNETVSNLLIKQFFRWNIPDLLLR